MALKSCSHESKTRIAEIKCRYYWQLMQTQRMWMRIWRKEKNLGAPSCCGVVMMIHFRAQAKTKCLMVREIKHKQNSKSTGIILFKINLWSKWWLFIREMKYGNQRYHTWYKVSLSKIKQSKGKPNKTEHWGEKKKKREKMPIVFKDWKMKKYIYKDMVWNVSHKNKIRYGVCL